MRPINIYALTRVSQPQRLERLERQMSGRSKFIKIKPWETESLECFCDRLCEHMPEAASLKFYYSFTLPKLGKEFDLLRVNGSSVIDIELKSGEVSEDAIRKQLLQNRYYLAILGRTMHFFTYISSTDRLVRMSHAGRLLEASWEELCGVLSRQMDCYYGEIEDLFKENRYLISPLTDPERFLRREYILTFQQRDIKKRILRNIRKEEDDEGAGDCLVQGFTGYPGTGKTILLYDLAMELSATDRVCLFHFGSHAKELGQLNKRLKRVDFYDCENDGQFEMRNPPYAAIFVDEGHRIGSEALAKILGFAKAWHAPVIFSYDSEAPIASEEQKRRSTGQIEAISGFIKYELTNRIRLNNEISAFIQCLMCVKGRSHRKDYANVLLLYAKDNEEGRILLQSVLADGYTYIRDALVDEAITEQPVPKKADCGDSVAEGITEQPVPRETASVVPVAEATRREFDEVVMVVDSTFYYDGNGYLRGTGDGRVRHLYHGLNRAKKRIALLVIGNEAVFDRLLGILQRK